MRHQKSERGGERGGERHEQRGDRSERGSQGRYQGRPSERGSERAYGRQDREDESSSRWQDRDEGRSYRSDDYDMQSRSGGDYDYGSREYQGLGSSRQTSRDQQQGYSSTYGSRDLDFGSASSTSRMPSGYGRGSYNEDEYRSGRSMASSSGQYSGRGPKGYKRSDERIKEEISDVLTRDANVDASEIEIEVKDGEVTLTGTVTERRMKHHAEDLVEKCMGVKDVTNNLRVQKESQRGQREEGREASYEGDGERKEGKTSAGQVASGKKGTSSTANPQH